MNFRAKMQAKRERLFHQQRGLCYYCRIPMLLGKGRDDARNPPHFATLDHIIPQSKRGSVVSVANMVAACLKCNCERGDTDARLFLLQKQGAL